MIDCILDLKLSETKLTLVLNYLRRRIGRSNYVDLHDSVMIR